MYRVSAFLSIIAGLIVLAGCESTGGRSHESFDVEEGIITFHDPAPVQHTGRARPRRLRPATIVITTRTAEGATVDTGDLTVTSTGRVGVGETVSPREVFLKAATKHRRVVSAAEFKAIWRGLVDIGLLDLPRHEGAEPPADSAWIRVQTEGRQAIFLKPVAGYREVRSEREHALNRVWVEAKLLILDILGGG